MCRIIFLDVDGTLINADGIIPASTKYAIKKAKENGHQLVICTGRSRFQLPEELMEMGFAGVISSDGADVEINGKRIYHVSMDESQRRQIGEYLESANAIYLATTPDEIVISETNKERLQKYIADKGWKEDYAKQIFGTYDVAEHIWKNEKEQKFVYFESDISIKEISQTLGPRFAVVPGNLIGANEKCGEITMNGESKASAVEIYLKHVGISKEKSIAIGDGANDIQMIKYAHIGVSMGNAKDIVKQSADLVTADIDQDGILTAFMELGLIDERDGKVYVQSSTKI